MVTKLEMATNIAESNIKNGATMDKANLIKDYMRQSKSWLVDIHNIKFGTTYPLPKVREMKGRRI